MKALIAVLSVVVVMLSAAFACLLAVGWVQNRGFRSDLAELRAQLEASRAQTEQLSAARQEAEARIAELRRELDAQQTETRARAEQQQAEEQRQATARAAASKPKPYQVPVYLGRDYLGTGWVVPSNLSEDEESGRITFTPTVHLGEELRKTLVVQETNVVEREVYRNQTMNYNLYPRPYYYYPWIWTHHRTPTPTNPPPDDPQPPPPAPPPLSRGKVWTPVTRLNQVQSAPTRMPPAPAPPAPRPQYQPDETTRRTGSPFGPVSSR